MTTQATKRPVQAPAFYKLFESRLNGKIVHQVFDIAYGEKGHSGSGGYLIAEAINKTQGEYLAKCINRANCHDELVEALEDAVKLISSEYCSHTDKCSKDNPSCYAQKQLQALAMEG